jgi:sec-independent protein translocase protein TatB
MFGMGFFEIFLVLLVAIIALGPEKLPGATVEVVKFFKKFKSGVAEAKATLDNELNISEMKQEADKFKASVSEIADPINNAASNLNASIDGIADDINDIGADEVKKESPAQIHRKQVNAQSMQYKEAATPKETKEDVAVKENITFDQGKA